MYNDFMRKRNPLRLVAAFILLFLSCCLLVWSVWPINRVRTVLPLPTLQLLTATPAGLVLADWQKISKWWKKYLGLLLVLLFVGAAGTACASAMATPAPAALPTEIPAAVEGTEAPEPTPLPRQEPRLISIEFPARIRVGEGDVIRLTLEVDPSGKITPTAEVGGHQVDTQAVNIPYVYDLYQVVAESRLDLAGMQVSPQEEVSEPLAPGKKVTFYWSISASQAGTYRGTLWLYLNLIPKQGGASDRQTLMAKRLDIDATTFLGLSAGTARAAGLVGSFFSLVMGFPFIERLLEAIWKKFHR
jgi:hypothetical protein